MKTAGVVLDFYDDVDGRVLKGAYPSAEELPDFVKEAHILTPEELDVLRDDAFGLVVLNEGKVLRKFACVDKGNTFLAALYFAENMDLFPEEAKYAAAERIGNACDLYGFDIPFIKEAREKKRSIEEAAEKNTKEKGERAASGMSRTRDPMQQPLVGDEADWAQRTNLVSVRGGSDQGRVIPTANQMKTANAVVPAAEAAAKSFGTKAMDAGKKAWEAAKPGLVQAKDTAVDYAKKNPLHAAGGAAAAGLVAGRMSKNAGIVDVTGKEPEQIIEGREAEHMALGQYPLDSYADVRAAAAYFDQSWTEFDPQQRHEFAVKTAARADDIGLEVSDLLHRYGSTEYAPDVEAHLSSRKTVTEPNFHEVYDALKEKRAELDPEVFVDLLARADIAAGINWYWGGQIADPWYSTFGGNSESEKTAYGWEGDGVSVGSSDLYNLASTKGLAGVFEPAVVSAFEKDPVTIFESLPDDAKTIIARIATGG